MVRAAWKASLKPIQRVGFGMTTEQRHEGKKMAKRPTNKVKIKVWTESATAELEGGIKDGAYYLFMFVPEADREQLLADMKQWHDESATK